MKDDNLQVVTLVIWSTQTRFVQADYLELVAVLVFATFINLEKNFL